MHLCNQPTIFQRMIIQILICTRCGEIVLRIFIADHRNLEPGRLVRSWVNRHPQLTAAQVRRVAGLQGVFLAEFDQCQFGLTSKEAKKPVKKRTSLLTNSLKVYQSFHQKFCSNDHTHQVISGSEGGMKRSTYAQCYPDAMCKAIAKALCEEQKAQQS